MTERTRLPNRRLGETREIEFIRSDGKVVAYEATVGFNPTGAPKEIFLLGAKDGSDMAAVLSDTAVALSVALQHGVSARAMAASIARRPIELDGPPIRAASIVGAALDLLAEYEPVSAEMALVRPVP